MANLLRLIACLLLCVSLNSYSTIIFDTNGNNCTVAENSSCIAGVFQGPLNLNNSNWSNSIIRAQEFDGISFQNSNFSGSNIIVDWLHDIDMSGSNFSNTDIIISGMSSDFSNSLFLNSNLNLSLISGDSFIGSNFTNSVVTVSGDMNFEGSDFSNSTLTGFNNGSSTFANVNFRNATLYSSGSMFEVNGFNGSDFCGASIQLGSDGVRSDAEIPTIFGGAIFCESTTLPNYRYYDEDENFNTIISYWDPVDDLGMIFVSEVPLPAGIYLFLSGLVGLGLMRGRKSK